MTATSSRAIEEYRGPAPPVSRQSRTRRVKGIRYEFRYSSRCSSPHRGSLELPFITQLICRSNSGQSPTISSILLPSPTCIKGISRSIPCAETTSLNATSAGCDWLALITSPCSRRSPDTIADAPTIRARGTRTACRYMWQPTQNDAEPGTSGRLPADRAHEAFHHWGEPRTIVSRTTQGVSASRSPRLAALSRTTDQSPYSVPVYTTVGMKNL